MSSPLFNVDIFNPILKTNQVRALRKFASNSETIESFITRTHVYANRTSGTTVAMDTCIFVLTYLEAHGYLRSAPFKNPYTYNGKELLNYFPTPEYENLLQANVVLPKEVISTEISVESDGPELDTSLKVTNLQLEITGKYYHLMRSASTRNKDFNLTRTDIRRLLERKTCFYTGLPFSTKEGSPYIRTIDRVNANRGYVKGNVVACCKMANEFKNQLLENGNGLSLDRKVIKRMLTLFLASMGEEE